MPVRLVPCRHKDTGATADIPETGLKHLRSYEPVDEADRKRLGYSDEAPKTDQPATGEPPSADDTTSSKPATGAAKKTKEHARDAD